jgi:hypothetical protein
MGQTSSGRYLKVIYVPDPQPDSVFVITACDPTGKATFSFVRFFACDNRMSLGLPLAPPPSCEEVGSLKMPTLLVGGDSSAHLAREKSKMRATEPGG